MEFEGVYKGPRLEHKIQGPRGGLFQTNFPFDPKFRFIIWTYRKVPYLDLGLKVPILKKVYSHIRSKKYIVLFLEIQVVTLKSFYIQR